MNIRLAVTAAALLVAAACSVKADGPPDIVVDRTACSHCGMLISEPLYAAAYRAAGATPRVFDDIGCLREAARAEAGPMTYWFHDAVDSTWIDGADALFVASSELRTPMGGGMLAYRDAAAAEHSRVTHRGRVVRSVADLLAKESGS